MIEPFIRVVCDGKGCEAAVEFSGSFADPGVLRLLGWVVQWVYGGQSCLEHTCPVCAGRKAAA